MSNPFTPPADKARCEPTAHRLVGKVVLPPLSRRAEYLRGPPAVAGSGVGYSFSSL
jgi:hypothetical protein